MVALTHVRVHVLVLARADVLELVRAVAQAVLELVLDLVQVAVQALAVVVVLPDALVVTIDVFEN